MAPKKKQQQQQQKQQKQKSSSSKSKSQSSSSGPKLQISAENENRLRRLLLNSGHSNPFPDPTPADDSLSKAQKAKKLRSIYEKLSCEGFSDEHIERVLSALKENATFEAALDWLCLNLAGNELPLKFAGGSSLHTNEGSVGILSIAQDDWCPSMESSLEIKDETPEICVKVKGQRDVDALESCQPFQADWIRQYVQQQEEDESENWESDEIDKGSMEQVAEPRSDPDSIIKEYQNARLEAINAKQRGDRKGQEQAGQIIRKLKQEMSALGLSDELLLSVNESTYNHASDETCDSMPYKYPHNDTLCKVEGGMESKVDQSVTESSSKELSEDIPSSILSNDSIAQEEESGDVELGNFLFEDSSSSEVLPPEVVKLQKKERISELSFGKNLEKLEGIWKKGDPQKIPKAILHQLCRKLGWEAPKYSKLLGKGHGPSYTVSVLRKASGRGKSRKAGGLVTLQLPGQDNTFETAEVDLPAVLCIVSSFVHGHTTLTKINEWMPRIQLQHLLCFVCFLTSLFTFQL